MDNLLSILEDNSAEQEIDETRLKYFTSKIKIWDYFNLPRQKLVSLSTEERSTMLKIYYNDLNSKYSAGKSLILLCFIGLEMLLFIFSNYLMAVFGYY